MKERNNINEVNKVCKAVLKLTDEDFSAVAAMAQGQKDYTSPLKMATTGWQHDLGNHNIRVLVALQNLRDVLRGGDDIHDPR